MFIQFIFLNIDFQEDVANMCNSNFDKVKTFIFHEFQEKIKCKLSK